MNQIPQAGEIYQHFKGKLYRIVALATHTETGEQLVIYQALYGEFQVFARPLSMFLEKVDAKKYPDAAGKDRFMRIPMAEAAAVPQPVPAPSENPVEPRPAAMPSENPVEPRLAAASSESPVEPQPDPGLLAFLDAESYEEKLEVFAALEGKADLHMLNAIAASLDLELSEGSLEEQYDTLKSCLMTLERYECNRLR
ncbi:DUF1653 domain-containing protein [Gallintestinimicrobium propionicum]|uniref:DUF1653 domain-containing protein n=1 Tax=Gallintestinimicrobium propionicum TaxID=2981770 RepID=A0AAE3AY59_9FIRM|nr:DUF1653 domain-containing protein [Gallintestinimicrobium propionicum]MCC2169030.1 DUF1653 domain-containing protein [Gallintestinimicrobium propionicum]